MRELCSATAPTTTTTAGTMLYAASHGFIEPLIIKCNCVWVVMLRPLLLLIALCCARLAKQPTPQKLYSRLGVYFLAGCELHVWVVIRCNKVPVYGS